MKFARVIAVLFGIAGLVLMLGTLGLCFASLDAPVKIIEYPQAAVDCSQELMDAIGAGDYSAAAGKLYGQPDLGADGEPQDEAGRLIWDAFIKSISCEFTSDCYAAADGLARNGVITTLDLGSVTKNLREYSQALLAERVAAATDMAELYDGEEFREDVVLEVLHQAVELALKQDAETVTTEVCLNLIFRDGQWWVVPDQALLKAISGNVG